MAVTPPILPNLYMQYTAGGISTGLDVSQPQFTLNDRNISLYSGAMHYFRIPKQHWRDRLRKARAAGLNAVETYVPWNLHEPQNGVFDFGAGGTDFQDFLDVEEYLKIAQEEDLFAIIRPGPYICAEWEWGGLPSWLLREKGIKVRTSDSTYMTYVKRYFGMLLSILTALQFTNGGPIIAFQVENEYGSAPQIDLGYVQQLVDILHDNGVKELLVTSDSAYSKTSGSLPDVLFQTVNFGSDPTGSFNTLKTFQPDKPIMAMEYWTGWFDHWSENHHTVSSETFRGIYESILSYPASVNMYMFHGGTNFGLLNGANIGTGDNSAFQPTTSSYDYDAPLAENGDYTEKYAIVKELLAKYNTIPTALPAQPDLVPRVAYPSISIEGKLNYEDILARVDAIESDTLLPMEQLPINNNSGQSYGYIVYRQSGIDIPADAVLTINGHIRDTVLVLVNGVLLSKPLRSSKDLNDFGYWRLATSEISLTSEDLTGATLDIVVENFGRANFGNLYNQYKGLGEDHTVLLNNKEVTSAWSIFPLEFKKSWVSALSDWKDVGEATSGPALYRATLVLDDEPVDTYVNTEAWDKGIVIVNGFTIGRFAYIGPQQSLYLPGPFLKKGENEIIIFEEFSPDESVTFSADPIFETF